jgi:hypothetical protein
VCAAANSLVRNDMRRQMAPNGVTALSRLHVQRSWPQREVAT